MLRAQFKLILQLSCSLLMLIFSFNCFADVSTFENGLKLTNTYQHPGDYYNDPSMPTPNPALFPPPPPKPTGLPLQPFMPTLTGQLNITKDEAAKLLSGYRNPSLPTPNPAFYPQPFIVIAPANQQTNNEQTTATQARTEGAASSGTGGAVASASTGGTAAAQQGSSSNPLQAAASGATAQGGSGASATQSNKSSSNINDLQNCVPGTYTFQSPAKPITVGAMYGSNNVSTPTMTYTVSGLQNGKCMVTVTQSAVVPPTVKNGTYYPAPASASPAANVQKCALSPTDLSSFVSQTQKTQSGGYYGTSTQGQNYYNRQTIQNSCQSSFIVNGAAIPYTSFP